jgi:hypothetical protein
MQYECNWRGPVDAQGRPHGHGIRAFPSADYPMEFDEGVMEAGCKQGTWVSKYRSGLWECTRDWNNDTCDGLGEVRPSAPWRLAAVSRW